jgi:hypothetical protein
MASARLRGKRWDGLYRDASGKQKSAGSYDTKDEALARATVLELDARPPADVDAYPAAVRGKPTLASYGRTAIAGARLEATSRENYLSLFRKHVEPALGSITLPGLSAADVRAFARKLEAGKLSAGTTKLILCVLKLVVRTAVQDGHLERDVTAGISVRQRGREKGSSPPRRSPGRSSAR